MGGGEKMMTTGSDVHGRNKMSQRSQVKTMREKCKEENIKLSQNPQTLNQRMEGRKYQDIILGGVGVTSNEETNFIQLLDRFTSSKETESVIIIISKS